MAEISTVNRAIKILRMKQLVDIEKVEKSQVDIF